MKFMVTWSVDQDQWIPILEKWNAMSPAERADVGEGVKLIGRWHDLNARTGVAILEASDMLSLSRYLGQWNPYMDLEVNPVSDDEESGEVVKAMLEVMRG